MERPLITLMLVCGALIVASCAPSRTDTVTLVSPVGRTGGGALQARSESGAATFARRIDGQVSAIYRAGVTADQDQLVVLTGLGGGSAQSSVLVLSDSGDLLASHRVSGDVPPMRPGEDRRYRFVAPSVNRLKTLTYGGRRLAVLTTFGTWGPYSVEIIEAEDARTLTPRFRFWSGGLPAVPVVNAESGLMAIHGLNNSYRRDEDEGTVYPTTLAVVSIDDALGGAAEDRVVEGVSPLAALDDVPESVGHDYVRYYLFPEFEGGGHSTEFVVTIEGRVVRATTLSGLTYVLAIDDEDVQLEADDAFRTVYDRDREDDPDLPDLEQWLAARVAQVRSFRPRKD